MFTVKIYTLDKKDKANGHIVFSCEDYHKAGSVLIFGDGISEVIGTAANFNRKNSDGSYDTIWSGNFKDIFIENQAGKTIDRINGFKNKEDLGVLVQKVCTPSISSAWIGLNPECLKDDEDE